MPSTIEDFIEAQILDQSQLCGQCGRLGKGNGLKFAPNVLHMKIDRMVCHVLKQRYLLGRLSLGGPF